MAQTTNFNLNLVAQGERITIDSINQNMEIIDAELGNGLALKRESVEVTPEDFKINADTLDGRESNYYLDYIVEHSKSGTVHTLTNPNNKSGIFLAIFTPTATYSSGDKFSINSELYTATDLTGSELTSNSLVIDIKALAIVDTNRNSLTIVSGGGSAGPSGNINYTIGTEDLVDGETPLAAGTFYFVP